MVEEQWGRKLARDGVSDKKDEWIKAGRRKNYKGHRDYLAKL